MPHHYAIFSAHFAPHVGGVESYTENLARQLVLRGNRATVVTSQLGGSPTVEARTDGVYVYRLPSHTFMKGRLPITRHNAAYHSLMTELGGRGIDRVLVNTRFYRHSLEGLRFAQSIGAPAVVIDHGTAHIVLGQKAADEVIARYEHAITKKVVGYRPVFAGISGKSAAWLGHFSIETTRVIPNALDFNAFRSTASARDFRAEFGLGPDDVLMAFVGRITPEKGPDALLEAARRVNDAHLHIVFAGEGYLKDSLVASLGSDAKNYHFVGAISREDLSALLSKSDFFCLPSEKYPAAVEDAKESMKAATGATRAIHIPHAKRA